MRIGGLRLGVLAVGVLILTLGGALPVAQGHGTSGTDAAEVVVPQLDDCLLADIDDAWDVQASIQVLDCSEVHNAQVFKTLPYPQSGERPSDLLKGNTFEWMQACSQDQVLAWLGAPRETTIPLRLVLMFRLPTDRQWEAGARWVICTASHPHPSSYGADTRGTLPEKFASTPRIQWVQCVDGLPPHGKFSFPLGCTSSSRWLFTGNVKVEGKVTRRYPVDLQAKANAACATSSAAFAKAGPRVKAVGVLFPKRHVFKRDPYAECFIPLAEWNQRF